MAKCHQSDATAASCGGRDGCLYDSFVCLLFWEGKMRTEEGRINKMKRNKEYHGQWIFHTNQPYAFSFMRAPHFICAVQFVGENFS